MPAFAGHTRRLSLNAIMLAAAFTLMPIVESQSLAQDAGRNVATMTAEVSDLGVLPTMKGYMGRLGTLMNVLFRTVHKPDSADDTLRAIEEMTRHLQEVGNTLLPDKVEAIDDKAQQGMAIHGFKACVDQAITGLSAIAARISAREFEAARARLLELDQLRRDCHSKYALLERPPTLVSSYFLCRLTAAPARSPDQPPQDIHHVGLLGGGGGTDVNRSATL